MVEDSMIVVNGNWGYDFDIPIVYKYLGDTNINSTTYFRVFKCSSLEDSSYSLNSNTSYFGAIREVNKKVYFLHKDSSQENKIYDFSLSVNDSTDLFFSTIYTSGLVKVKLNRIDSITKFYGRNIRYHDMFTTGFFPSHITVEGFGNIDLCANEIETDNRARKLCSIKKNNSSHNIPADYTKCYWQIKNSFISLDEIGLNEIEVFPNPTVGEITIKSIDSKIKSVSVFDVNGKFIDQFSVSENKKVVDLKIYESGIYMLRIVTNKGIVTKKIIKK